MAPDRFAHSESEAIARGLEQQNALDAVLDDPGDGKENEQQYADPTDRAAFEHDHAVESYWHSRVDRLAFIQVGRDGA